MDACLYIYALNPSYKDQWLQSSGKRMMRRDKGDTLSYYLSFG